ncbi:MAG TPA: sugar phosphate isomerase/epimerase [bacterium]|nr:sugar phosphate isomerase/epimerase [bacterium]HPN45624.1 sugar phosphate isomerase/epimerase [bacterium]
MQERNNELSRREFTRTTLNGVAAMMTVNYAQNSAAKTGNRIHLGGPVFADYHSPEEWVNAVKALGYSAAYCPVDANADEKTVQAYAVAAEKSGIIIAEVGVWNNPLAADAEERRQALEKCRVQLYLAERIGARCCVNISGSRGRLWDGPDRLNLTRETFDMIVEITRSIIDAVNPKRTFFTLEPMPWAYPDSPDSYLELLKAIDRKQCAAHLDPVNMINSPRRYYDNAEFLRECFKKLGPHLKSIHAKDIILQTKLTVHLDEIVAGQGGLDYRTFLTEAAKLGNIPFMLEHLQTPAEYEQAAGYVRSVAGELGLEY